MPRQTDFYRLSRPVQDRFAAATRRSAPPAPLLFEPAPRTRVWTFLGLGVGLIVSAIIVLRQGWGEVASSMAIHKAGLLLLDVLLFSAAAYCLLHAVALLRTMESMPWRPGVYLFPASVVDGRDPVLRIWPVADSEAIDRMTAPRPGLALRMRDGSRVIVGAASPADAERAEAALASRRGELAQAIAQEDPHLLAELDPLHDNALSSPIGPSEAMRKAIPMWARLDWALALGVGVVLGLGIGETRNSMSDTAMFRTVAASENVDQLKAYLGHGGKHSAEVSEVLLPRAELKDAEAQGTVEAVKTFADQHPSSKIGPEIDAALRRVMLAELERAKAAGTVSALDDFAHKYPYKLVDRELGAARHAVYVASLATWGDAAKVDAPTRAFMQRLLGWVEKNGPACELHFRALTSKTMDDADKSVMHSGHYPGTDALPSRYVTPDQLHPREDRIAADVAQALSAAFPADVLKVKAGPTLASDAQPPAGVPALVVEYAPEWSRLNTLSTRPPTVFAGLNFTFDSTFTLPDGSPPLKFSTRAWRGAELWKIHGTADMTREDYEKTVYDQMIDGAFDYLGKKLKDAFF
jgi:hypothetical protein